jgi:hypothetical protein
VYFIINRPEKSEKGKLWVTRGRKATDPVNAGTAGPPEKSKIIFGLPATLASRPFLFDL